MAGLEDQHAVRGYLAEPRREPLPLDLGNVAGVGHERDDGVRLTSGHRRTPPIEIGAAA